MTGSVRVLGARFPSPVECSTSALPVKGCVRFFVRMRYLFRTPYLYHRRGKYSDIFYSYIRPLTKECRNIQPSEGRYCGKIYYGVKKRRGEVGRLDPHSPLITYSSDPSSYPSSSSSSSQSRWSCTVHSPPSHSASPSNPIPSSR